MNYLEYQYSGDLDNFFGEYDLPLERILFDLEQFQYNHYILKDRNWLAFDFVDPLKINWSILVIKTIQK